MNALSAAGSSYIPMLALVVMMATVIAANLAKKNQEQPL
jgi:hypothetical protein